MSVIHLGLFSVIERFPDCENEFRKLYQEDDLFQSICESYKQCSDALRYWAEARNDDVAPERHREYQTLLKELEMEIQLFCSDGCKASLEGGKSKIRP